MGIIYNRLSFRFLEGRFVNLWKYFIGIVISTFLLSGGAYSQAAEPTNLDADLLVSGKIVRSKESFDYKGPVTFPKDAHALVTLTYVSGVNGMTGGTGPVVPGILSVTQKIENVKGFPIAFRLEGSPEEVFRFPAHSYGTGGYYSVSATVYMGTEDELYIGDFDNAFLNVVYGPTTGVQLKLSRVEDCSSSKPAAFCASEKRSE